MKTLSQILNSASIVEDANLTEGTAWKILNTTLHDLGFKPAPKSEYRDFTNAPKEDILNLYGIPMRAGKWADVWFAILEDDVYIIANGKQTYEYGHMGDAIKAIQKIGVQQKKNAVNEAVELEEKLSAEDDAGIWISDFVKSTDPRFEGKSKKERIKMALGAYYAAQNEEVEDLEEAIQKINVDKLLDAAAKMRKTFPQLRKGQSIMIALNDMNPTLYSMAVAKADAFTVDAKIPALIKLLDPNYNITESIELEESFTAATASKITGAQIEKYLDSQDFKAIEQICKFMTKDELKTWSANGYEGRTYELLMKSRLKNEEFEDIEEGLAQPFAVIDTGDNNIVVAMASSEARAKSSIATSELPPMSVKDKNKLKIVRIKKKALLGWPLNEGTQLDEEVDYYKFKQLAILGLLSPGDANKAALGMKAIEGGHPPTQEQKKIIGDTLVLLVDMITGDSAVLNKLKKTARDAKNATA